MAYLELAAAIYLAAIPHFLTTHDTTSTVLFKLPMFPAGMLLGADALARLGLI